MKPAVGSELHPGDVLDERFLITEIISRSGMAMIYKAQDLHNQNAPVAVKVPHFEYESDPGFFTRFRREEQIGCSLNHPYLLTFIPVASPKSRPYIVTEYLRGCTLAHLLDRMCPLPEKAIQLEEQDVWRPDGATVKLQLPHVLRDLCIGCGLCEYRCPVSGDAAIRVYVPPLAVPF